MTASPASESTGTVHIAISGPQSASYDTTPTAPVEHQFIEPGTYTVEATYTGGITASRSLTVTVLGAPSQPIVNALVANNLTVCVADQFRLSAFPDTIASNSVKIIVADPLGTTNRYLSTTDSPVPYQFDKPGEYSVQGIYSDGAATLTNGITVTVVDPGLPTVNVLDASDMGVRANDILSFIVLPTSNTNGWYALSIDGPSPDLDAAYTNDVSVVVDHAFTQTGTYTVAAVFTAHSDQSQTSGSITVTVGEGSLVTPACLVGQDRTIDIPTMPDGVVLDGGAAIGVEVATASNNVMQATLTADADGPQHVVARLGDDGPIIASAPVSAFTLFIDESRYQWADDRRHVESAIVADYLPSTVVIEKEMVSEDAYIDVNRTLSKDTTANVSAMDPSGLSVAMILPDADDKTIDSTITVSAPLTLSGSYLSRTGTGTELPTTGIVTLNLTPVPVCNTCSGEPCMPNPVITGPLGPGGTPSPIQGGVLHTFSVNAEYNDHHNYNWAATMSNPPGGDDPPPAQIANGSSVQFSFYSDSDVVCTEGCTRCPNSKASDPYHVTLLATGGLHLKAKVGSEDRGSILKGGGETITITAYSDAQCSQTVSATWKRSQNGGAYEPLSEGTSQTQGASTKGTFTFKATRTVDGTELTQSLAVYVAEISGIEVRESKNINNKVAGGATATSLSIFQNFDATTENIDMDVSLDPANADASLKNKCSCTISGTGGTASPSTRQFSSSGWVSSTITPISPVRMVTVEAGGYRVNVKVHQVRIVCLTLGADVDQDMIRIKQDNGTYVYDTYQWRDEDENGEPDTPIGHPYPHPLLFVRNARPHVFGKLVFTPPPDVQGEASKSIKVRLSSDSWFTLSSETTLTKGTSTSEKAYYLLPQVSSVATVGNVVGYDARATLKWEYSVDNKPWRTAGNTWNRKYICYRRPVLGGRFVEPYESVVHLSCCAAAGNSSDIHVATKMQILFNGFSVNLYTSSGTVSSPLRYFVLKAPSSKPPVPWNYSLLNLLNGSSGYYGDCGQFSALFANMLEYQGIPATLMSISPVDTAEAFLTCDFQFRTPAVFYPPPTNKKYIILGKSFWIGNNCDIWTGQPCQGVPHSRLTTTYPGTTVRWRPDFRWTGHVVVALKYINSGQTYDPTYGNWALTRRAYENEAVAGFTLGVGQYPMGWARAKTGKDILDWKIQEGGL